MLDVNDVWDKVQKSIENAEVTAQFTHRLHSVLKPFEGQPITSALADQLAELLKPEGFTVVHSAEVLIIEAWRYDKFIELLLTYLSRGVISMAPFEKLDRQAAQGLEQANRLKEITFEQVFEWVNQWNLSTATLQQVIAETEQFGAPLRSIFSGWDKA